MEISASRTPTFVGNQNGQNALCLHSPWCRKHFCRLLRQRDDRPQRCVCTLAAFHEFAQKVDAVEGYARRTPNFAGNQKGNTSTMNKHTCSQRPLRLLILYNA